MATPQSTVTYRDIPGFPGYRVGDDGSVWSCMERYTIKGITGAYQRPGEIWKLKKQSFAGSTGRRHLVASLNNKKHYVHRLVLLAFVGPCPDGMEARHLDDDSTNNNLSNLVWGTRGENIADREKNGGGSRGEKSGVAKLTETQVKQMRSEYAQGGTTFEKLGLQYGICTQQAHSIVRRKSWRHVA